MVNTNMDSTTDTDLEISEDKGTSQSGGPLGNIIGQYIDGNTGSFSGDKFLVKSREGEEESGGESQKKKGGSCSGDSSGNENYKASDGQCHKTPDKPKEKLEIEENTIPENWWDKLPDFDPRVYDAISMEQAAACVKYVFEGLPDMHELENQIEARKHRKICPRLKADVPRTKIVKPREVIYTTRADSWITKDQAY